MMGLNVAMTALELPPRRVRISDARRFQTRLTAAVDGLSSSLRLGSRRILNVRKSKPSLKWTILVLSSLKASL
jgi:hypothetical protein